MNESIVVCGQKCNIGTRVILWDEPNGFNGYGVSKSIIKIKGKKKLVSGKRYSKRSVRVTDPDLTQLKQMVTQFFLHHDGLYRAADTFNVLHNQRGLSVHFILDDDGTLYQTLDLKEKAWHGGINNPMSVGIEISNRANARKFPDAYNLRNQRKRRVSSRLVRNELIGGRMYKGFEYTNKQYETLILLARCLLSVFPKINCDFPRNPDGKLTKGIIDDPMGYCGFICHYNINESKWDPVAFDYSRFLSGVSGCFIPASNFDNLDDWRGRQILLELFGYDPGVVDGVFGDKTKNALKKFQEDHNLKSDGLWGRRIEANMIEEINNMRR